MLKRAFLLACMAMTFAGCAHSPASSDSTASLLTEPAERDPAGAGGCQTGSLIPRTAGMSGAQVCRSFSHADLERAGTTTAEALRRLDPAIR